MVPEQRKAGGGDLRVDEQLDALVKAAGVDVGVLGKALGQGNLAGGEKNAAAVVEDQLAPAPDAVVDDERALGIGGGTVRLRRGPGGGVDLDQRQGDPGEQGEKAHPPRPSVGGEEELGAVLLQPDGDPGEGLAFFQDFGGIHGRFLSVGNSLPFWDQNGKWG